MPGNTTLTLHEYFDVDLEIRESTPNRTDESPDRAVPSYQISVCVVGNVVRGEELADRLKFSVAMKAELAAWMIDANNLPM